MASLNKVLLIGNLTRDPDLRYTPKGTAVAEISLACNEKRKDQAGNYVEEVTFVDVTLWSSTAENVSKYLVKGSPIFVEGKLSLDQWEDKQTGQKRSKLKVVGFAVQFLPDGKDRSGNRGGDREGRDATGQQSSPNRNPNGSVPPGHTWADDDAEDDIPF